MSKWTCQCGTVNEAKFCTSCGLPREEAAVREIVNNEPDINSVDNKENVNAFTNGGNIAAGIQNKRNMTMVLIAAVLLLAAYFGYGKIIEYRYENECSRYVKLTSDFNNTLSALYDLNGDPEEEARKQVLDDLKKESETAKEIQQYVISSTLPDSALPVKDRTINALQKHIDVIDSMAEIVAYDGSMVGKDSGSVNKKLHKLFEDCEKDWNKLSSYADLSFMGKRFDDLVDIDDVRSSLDSYLSSKKAFDENKWREEEKKQREEKLAEKAKQQSLGSAAADEAAQVLYAYHGNITKKNLKAAYDCTSSNWQGHVSYDGWSQGFKTTVSSEVSDVRCTSSSANQVVLNYVLTAVDNPGGARKFNGTAVLIKTDKGWKIDNMENKARQ